MRTHMTTVYFNSFFMSTVRRIYNFSNMQHEENFIPPNTMTQTSCEVSQDQLRLMTGGISVTLQAIQCSKDKTLASQKLHLKKLKSHA